MKSLPAYVPSVEQVRRCLDVWGYSGLKRLAADSELHVGTLNKIRRGETRPQLHTVHQFWPHLPRKARGG